MLPHVNWLHVIVSAAAGFAISMIFYSLPIMQKVRSERAQAKTHPSKSETLSSAIMKRLVNTFLYAFMLAWFLDLTGITGLGMGLVVVIVGMLRAAFAPGGWNEDMIGLPRNVRLVDSARFILMYVVMAGILIFWR